MLKFSESPSRRPTLKPRADIWTVWRPILKRLRKEGRLPDREPERRRKAA